jgi:transglutaminase-like putative cysteine protease
MGFDPTHDRAVDSRYLTVAVGQNYSDVAPTSGSFRGSARGSLDVQKQVTEIAPNGAAPFRPVIDGDFATSVGSTTGASVAL